MDAEIEDRVGDAARAVAEAEALLITAGAGMGVDSGLPDFRGNRGFWKAYPPMERLGISFVDMANPAWFSRDPECPRCGELARPNVLMFNDWHWIPHRSSAQERRLEAWIDEAKNSRLVIIELGAGSAVPTVRMTSERVARSLDATLVRINPQEPLVPGGHVSLPLGALEALEAIDERL